MCSRRHAQRYECPVGVHALHRCMLKGQSVVLMTSRRGSPCATFRRRGSPALLGHGGKLVVVPNIRVLYAALIHLKVAWTGDTLSLHALVRLSVKQL